MTDSQGNPTPQNANGMTGKNPASLVNPATEMKIQMEAQQLLNSQNQGVINNKFDNTVSAPVQNPASAPTSKSQIPVVQPVSDTPQAQAVQTQSVVNSVKQSQNQSVANPVQTQEVTSPVQPGQTQPIANSGQAQNVASPAQSGQNQIQQNTAPAAQTASAAQIAPNTNLANNPLQNPVPATAPAANASQPDPFKLPTATDTPPAPAPGSKTIADLPNRNPKYYKKAPPELAAAVEDKQMPLPDDHAEGLNMAKYESKSKKRRFKIGCRGVVLLLVLIFVGWATYLYYTVPDYLPLQAATYLNEDYGLEFNGYNYDSVEPIVWGREIVEISEAQIANNVNNGGETPNVVQVEITDTDVKLFTQMELKLRRAEQAYPVWVVFKLIPVDENDGTFKLASIGPAAFDIPATLYGDALQKRITKNSGLGEDETASSAIVKSMFGEQAAFVFEAEEVKMEENRMMMRFNVEEFDDTIDRDMERLSAPDGSLPDSLNDAIESQEQSRRQISEGFGEMQELLDDAGYDVDIDAIDDSFANEEKETDQEGE